VSSFKICDIFRRISHKSITVLSTNLRHTRVMPNMQVDIMCDREDLLNHKISLHTVSFYSCAWEEDRTLLLVLIHGGDQLYSNINEVHHFLVQQARTLLSQSDLSFVVTATWILLSGLLCHLLLGEIAPAQAILPIATHFSVAWSVVCHIRAPWLNRSTASRCHLAGTHVGCNDTLC